MWRNWSGDQVCTPAHLERPASVDEVAAVVTAAVDRGDVVRVVGAGHSFGDNVLTDGTLINLDHLTGVGPVDPATGHVRVAAGTRLYDLNTALTAQGRAMANLGDINVQSAAGAISTGTHGTGALLGNLATFVESLELVDATGAVRELSGEDLRAGRVSVGALGVITAYTLRTVPSFRLEERRGRTGLDSLLGELDARVDGNDHFEFFVFPHSDTAIFKELNRTDAPITASGKVRAWVDEVFLENIVLEQVFKLGRRFPTQIPRLNRMVTSLAGGSTKVGHSTDIFSSLRSVRFTETEWAFPREVCAEAFGEIKAASERHDVNFPLEVRFVAGDTDSMLSPAYGRPTAYIAAHVYREMDWKPFFADITAIGAAYGGRPHWGKRHDLDAATLAARYPEWQAFQDVRRRFDPEGRFANAHIRRIFG